MASVYRKRHLEPIPKGARRITLAGKPAVRYRDGRGRLQKRLIRLARNGTEKVIVESRHWWMKYSLPDGTIRRERGFVDRAASEQEACRLELEAACAKVGLLPVARKHLEAPLEQHLDAFTEDLERRGKAQTYYELCESRLRRMFDECGWITLTMIEPAGLTAFLAKLRREGKAPKTRNEYAAAAKCFCKWAVGQRRLAANPLECIRLDKVEPAQVRRSLTVEEAQRLLDVAGKRRLGYLLALPTGLRRSEIRALEWRDLELDTVPAWIHLRASPTKSKRADKLPIRSDLARELRAVRPADARLTDKVIPTLPRMHTMKLDLEAAGIPYRDDAGRKVDFHALRVTYNTWLGNAGTAFRLQMQLMRHTDPRLTAKTYTDPAMLNMAGAVEALPSLDGSPSPALALRRTGTDNAAPQGTNENGHLNGVSESPEGYISDHIRGHRQYMTPAFTGVSDGGGGNRTRVP
jgi:integrase/recombinase XerC